MREERQSPVEALGSLDDVQDIDVDEDEYVPTTPLDAPTVPPGIRGGHDGGGRWHHTRICSECRRHPTWTWEQKVGAMTLQP